MKPAHGSRKLVSQQVAISSGMERDFSERLTIHRMASLSLCSTIFFIPHNHDNPMTAGSSIGDADPAPRQGRCSAHPRLRRSFEHIASIFRKRCAGNWGGHKSRPPGP